MKLRLQRREGYSRIITWLATNRVYGITGTDASARYASLVADFQDFGKGPLFTGEYEHIDKYGSGNTGSTNDVAVSEVMHNSTKRSTSRIFSMCFIDT